MYGNLAQLPKTEQAEYEEYLGHLELLAVMGRFEKEIAYQLRLRESLPRDEKQVSAATWLQSITGLELTAGEKASVRAAELEQVRRDCEQQRAE